MDAPCSFIRAISICTLKLKGSESIPLVEVEGDSGVAEVLKFRVDVKNVHLLAVMNY